MIDGKTIAIVALLILNFSTLMYVAILMDTIERLGGRK